MNSLTFKRLDHVSLSVAELKPVIDFYADVFGATVAYRMGPFDAAEIPRMEDGRDWTDAMINVPDACVEIAMLTFPDGSRMEVLAYSRPADAASTPPRNCDVGSRHLCFEVGDIDEAIAFLQSKGCTPMAGSIDMSDGPCPASRSWYVLDPFGNQLELVQYL